MYFSSATVALKKIREGPHRLFRVLVGWTKPEFTPAGEGLKGADGNLGGYLMGAETK